MKIVMKFITKSEKQTIALGKKLARRLKGGEVLALTGQLGAGKTTLIKGLAQGLGIKRIITSPTFLLMRVYGVRGNKKGIKTLVHIDCYRLKSSKDILAIGAQEYFGQKDVVAVIEWADKITKILPRQKLNIVLKWKDQNQRRINFYGI